MTGSTTTRSLSILTILLPLRRSFQRISIHYPALQNHILSHRIFESELHGLTHWQQVERNGLLLATETGADTTVVRLFALFHDSKRADDGFDMDHTRLQQNDDSLRRKDRTKVFR